MSDTPETDAAVLASAGQWSFVLKETCQKLERERDEARADAKALAERLTALELTSTSELARLERERDEAKTMARVELITPQKNTPVAEYFSSSSTPETDAFSVKFKSVCGSKAWVPTDICRRLERERDEAREAIIATLEENRHLADGYDCTLAKLKSVVPDWK